MLISGLPADVKSSFLGYRRLAQVDIFFISPINYVALDGFVENLEVCNIVEETAILL